MTQREIVDMFLATKPEHRSCPECQHGLLSLSEATVSEPMIPGYYVNDGRPLPRRERECLVWACNACEFVTEVRL